MPSDTGTSGPVLAFDTSAAHCAAALLISGAIVAERHEEMARGQSERLMSLLADVLDTAGLAWRDLVRIGVGIGPGNFTGLRISVAAARGLSLGLGIPAVGISSLHALAEGTPGEVITSVDARRDLFYIQADDVPILASFSDLPELPAGATCIGHEAEKLAKVCGGKPAFPAYPIAHAIARRAARMIPDARPAPLYIRPPDAAPAGRSAPVGSVSNR